MAAAEILFYQETGGAVPVQEWLATLRGRHPRVFAKCRARVERLAEVGYEMRRPEAA